MNLTKLLLIAAAWCVILAAPALADATSPVDRPNVVLFIADDMAWNDCGAYGHPHIRTPNIDRLARQGMRFDNAFLTCSSCSPSRASIITGRYPHNTGAYQLHMPLPADQVTFVELLNDAGYYTAAAGKWHLGKATEPKFDRVYQGGGQWVEALRQRDRDRPFFLWLAFHDPHRPYRDHTIARRHTAEDVIVPPYLPDVSETREDLARYYDEIARLDGVVGKVLAVLDDQPAYQNTMVMFISDNGRPFPRCKTTIYDSGIKTPFIVRWPRRVAAGSTCKSLISTVDIAPTVLQLAGVQPPSTFEGKSLLPLLNDPQETIRDFVFAEHNWHDFDDHVRAVRSQRFKYIRNYYTDVPGTPPADAVRSITFQAMRRLRAEGNLTSAQMSCFRVPRPREELYEMTGDPHELRNLAENARYAASLMRLRRVLDAWEAETGDRVPDIRRPDEFDRETGERLPEFARPAGKRTQRDR